MLEAADQRFQCAGDSEGARRQQLAQHQRDQLALAVGQREQTVALQILGHQIIQARLVRARRELTQQWNAPGVLDVGLDLAAQGAFADRADAVLQLFKAARLAQITELLAKAVEVAEHAIVDEAHQSVEFQECVLQGCGCEEHLARMGKRIAQSARRLVVGLVDVAQSVCLVHHHQIPGHRTDGVRFAGRKLVRANDDAVGSRPGDGSSIEWIVDTVLDALPERLRFENGGGKPEFVGQFLMPLLAQVGRCDDQNAALAFGPALRDQETGFDGLAQAHLIGQDHALGKRIARGEQGRIDLMRVQIDLRIQQSTSHPVHGVGRTLQRQLVGEVGELVRAVQHRLHFTRSGAGVDFIPARFVARVQLGDSLPPWVWDVISTKKLMDRASPIHAMTRFSSSPTVNRVRSNAPSRAWRPALMRKGDENPICLR